MIGKGRRETGTERCILVVVGVEGGVSANKDTYDFAMLGLSEQALGWLHLT